MIKLVVVKNPFNPQDGRVVKKVKYKECTVKDLMEQHAIKGVEMEATVNGYTVKEDTIIKDKDFVVIYPVIEKGGKGKSILGLVAAIGLAVVSMGVGSMAAGMGWSMGGLAAATGSAAVMGYLAAAAVMFLGNTLIGRFMGKGVDIGSYGESNPTYSWSGVTTMEGQNNAIALTYGKVKSGGQTIGKYINVKDDKEYLNWLVSAGEGELEITDVRLNDNPISYYDGVTCEIRNGTNEQEVISNFNDTYFTKPLSYELVEDTWRTETVQGNATEGLSVKINFPSGLFYINDKGDVSSASVTLEIQYRKKGGDYWQTLTNERIEESSTSPVKREFTVHNIGAGAYEVRAKVSSRSAKVEERRASTRCYWTELTSIVYDDFSYPCIALIGLKAMATNQISGSPQLTFMKERKNVWVYNSIAGEYVEKPANNPAWACYDMIHQARRIRNINTDKYEFEVRGAKKELMRYEDFLEWAVWCEQKNLEINVEINTLGELLDVVNKEIAPVGRGMVVQFGTKFGAVYSHATQPVQMFGMGNIKSGSFVQNFLKLDDRANAIEVTFTNADAGYERDTLTIYGDTYDTDEYEKVAHLTMNGITSYKQAFREGKYQLECNKRQRTMVTFEVGIDALACTVGDVVLVSHDIPKWAVSGRIYSIDGDVITVPVELTEKEESYIVQYRTESDNLYTKPCTILSSADGWTKFKIDGVIDEPIKEGDVFDLAIKNIGSKPFIIKSINRAEDLTRLITAIEYDEALFEENYEIPEINYSPYQGEAEDVRDVKFNLAQYTDENGIDRAKLRLEWAGIPKGRYMVYLTKDNGKTWELAANNIAQTNLTVMVKPHTTYRAKIITMLGLSKSKGYITDPIYPDGKGLPVVTDLKGYCKYRGVADGRSVYDIVVKWKPPLLTSYLKGEVYYKTNNDRVVDIVAKADVPVSEQGFNGEWQYAGDGVNQVTIPQVTLGDTYQIVVCTRDKFGKKTEIDWSPQIKVVATTKTELPNTPDNFSLVFKNGEAIASWEEVTNSDIDYYEIKGDEVLVRTQSTSVKLPLKYRSGQLFLYARSVLGKYSYPATLKYNKPVPKKPKPPVVKAVLRGVSITFEKIPEDCIGAIIYIDDTAVKVQNNCYFYSCEAGIYDVKVAFYDMFGEGEKSAESRVVVKPTIPQEWIDKEKLGLTRVENAIKDIEKTFPRLDNIDEELEKRIASGAEKYYQSKIGDTLGEVESRITQLSDTVNITIDNKIKGLSSQITQLEGTIYQKVTKNVDGKIEALSSRIVQTESTIYQNVDNKIDGLNSKFTQLDDTINLKVTRQLDGKADKANLISQINLSPEAITIDGRFVHVTGATLFDNNVIVNRMLAAKAVSADKLDVNELSAITANIGLLRTATIGARTEISNNLIEVFDSNGRLRVRMGVW